MCTIFATLGIVGDWQWNCIYKYRVCSICQTEWHSARKYIALSSCLEWACRTGCYKTFKEGMKKLSNGSLETKSSRFLFKYRSTPQSNTYWSVVARNYCTSSWTCLVHSEPWRWKSSEMSYRSPPRWRITRWNSEYIIAQLLLIGMLLFQSHHLYLIQQMELIMVKMAVLYLGLTKHHYVIRIILADNPTIFQSDLLNGFQVNWIGCVV